MLLPLRLLPLSPVLESRFAEYNEDDDDEGVKSALPEDTVNQLLEVEELIASSLNDSCRLQDTSGDLCGEYCLL